MWGFVLVGHCYKGFLYCTPTSAWQLGRLIEGACSGWGTCCWLLPSCRLHSNWPTSRRCWRWSISISISPMPDPIDQCLICPYCRSCWSVSLFGSLLTTSRHGSCCLYFRVPTELTTRQRQRFWVTGRHSWSGGARGDLARLTLLDLSAVFDIVDHKTLLHRLDVLYGVSDTVHRWFVSYFSRRSQFVRCGSSSSLPKAVLFGVPQGSVLGPILFLL